MRTALRPIGTSEGVIIPSAFLKLLNIPKGAELKITLVDEKIIIEKLRSKFTLDELVSQMSPENEHESVWGEDVGHEVVEYVEEETHGKRKN